MSIPPNVVEIQKAAPSAALSEIFRNKSRKLPQRGDVIVVVIPSCASAQTTFEFQQDASDPFGYWSEINQGLTV